MVDTGGAIDEGVVVVQVAKEEAVFKQDSIVSVAF